MTNSKVLGFSMFDMISQVVFIVYFLEKHRR